MLERKTGFELIFDRLVEVQKRIATAASRSERDPKGVQLVAVTKYASLDAMVELLKTGRISEIGENRLQDALRKTEVLRGMQRIPRVNWRMIGHLQSNKAKKALEVFDTVDSVDSLKLAEILDEAGKDVPVLVQVKLSGMETQSGVPPEDLPELLKALARHKRLKVQGLMGMAPMLDPVEATRPHFKRLKQLFDRHFPEGGTLSMGMSRDYEIAVEEGATMVRIGSALFK